MRRPTQSGVGSRACAEAAAATARTRLGQPRGDAALGKIDVQIHQLLRRSALAAFAAKHLVRQVQALAVGAKDLRRHPHSLADQ